MTAATQATHVASKQNGEADGSSCSLAHTNGMHAVVCPPPDPAALGAGPADFDRSPTAARNLRLLFQEQRRFLNYFFEHLDYEPVERFAKARAHGARFTATVVSRQGTPLRMHSCCSLDGEC